MLDFISDRAGQVLDWAVNGNPVTIFGKIIAISVVVAAAIASTIAIPVHAVAQFISRASWREYKDLVAEIDQNPIVFTSIESAKAEHFSDKQVLSSKQAALKWDDDPLIAPSYRLLEACKNRHGENCIELKTENVLSLTPTGLIMPDLYTTITYRPAVVGWQASARNLCKAVPLYASSKAGYGMRADLTLVSLS